jgi:hypothetical protein
VLHTFSSLMLSRHAPQFRADKGIIREPSAFPY